MCPGGSLMNNTAMAGTRTRRDADPGVDRKSALVAEENFFERLAAVLKSTPGVYNPFDQRTYDAGPRNRVTKTLEDRSTDVKALIKKYAERDLMRTYEEMPKNGVVLHEILHKELLGRPAVRIVIVGAAFSPLEELIKQGVSRRAATASEFNRVRENVSQNPGIFHFIGGFSTTGWAEEARRVLVGPNFLGALCDLNDGLWRTYYAADPRWRAAARLFDLSSEEEKIEGIRTWVRRHTFELLMDELTEDRVFEETGYAVPIIREAFERIASEDRYVRLDNSGRPHRLVRTYG